jgi:hypothetical protein
MTHSAPLSELTAAAKETAPMISVNVAGSGKSFCLNGGDFLPRFILLVLPGKL